MGSQDLEGGNHNLLDGIIAVIIWSDRIQYCVPVYYKNSTNKDKANGSKQEFVMVS